MSKTKTVFSKDKKWKIVAEAWKTDYYIYKSIGTQVTVFKNGLSSVWGSSGSKAWVKTNAKSITITNRYLVSDPKNPVIEYQHTCKNSSSCSLKHWHLGLGALTITFPGEPGAGGGSIGVKTQKADFIVVGVIGKISVNIGYEILFADVKNGQ